MEPTTTVFCPYCNSDTLVILDGMDGELDDLVSDCELYGIDLKALHKLETLGRVMMKLMFLI